MEKIEIKDTVQDFMAARVYIEKRLKRNRIADSIISETFLIFEALYHNIAAQSGEAAIEISVRERLGFVSITIGYEGKMFIPVSADTGEISPEDSILTAYDDRFDCTYRAGYNKITITAKRGAIISFFPCLIGIFLAIIVYIPVHFLVNADGKTFLLSNIVFPFEELFTNAMLLAGAPMTFLSLMKNLTDTYIISDRNSKARRLHIQAIISSAIIILLAIAASFIIARLSSGEGISFVSNDNMRISIPIPDFISSLLPDNILTPFMTISPFPLIIIAIIVTYALCSSGRYFDRVKKFIDTGYALFSKIISIIIYSLPFFIFVAIMDMLLTDGFSDLLFLLELIVAVTLSTVLIIGFYLVRLLIHKVPIRPFLKQLLPLLVENIKINSAIDAVPFNIRYCAKNMGMDRKNLEKSIPVLAQVNLDGNCYFISLIILTFILISDTQVSVLNIITLAFMVLFLSLGAPNQAGSMLIAMVIILNYMQAHDLIPLAIFCEVFFGTLLNVTNVCGDIVTVANQELGRK